MLEFQTLKDQEAAGGPLIADRRLFLAADENTIVEDGDERAAFLLCGAGATIHAPTVKRLRLHLVDGRVMQGEPGADAPKEHKPAENKELTPSATKTGGKGKGFFGGKKG